VFSSVHFIEFSSDESAEVRIAPIDAGKRRNIPIRDGPATLPRYFLELRDQRL
jgi:hypothetical protein